MRLRSRTTATRPRSKKTSSRKTSPPIVATPVVKLRKRTIIFRVASVLLLSLTLIVAGSSYLFYQLILKDLPSPITLQSYKPISSTKLYDRNHNLLYTIYKDENRTPISIHDVPPYLIDATVSVEDKEFFSHRGISLRGIIRAFRSLGGHGNLQGGSTITQQLVKNTLLTRERTFKRKLKEAVLAIEVERLLTKQQILELYLNEVSYGGSIYGIEQAAQTYFHKPAHDLTLAESALLAGLPAAPSAYLPTGSTPELSLTRQQEVLRRMVEDGKITQEQADAAKNEPLALFQPTHEIKAPHFVMYVKDLLSKLYGDDELLRDGLEVTTTLDLPLQLQAQTIVQTEVGKLKGYNVSNGAALITNPGSGEILAMVGSRDYFDTKHDGQVNVTIRPRQPGSSIKPLMYSAALEHGFTPASIVDDAPISYSVPGSVPYTPKNYDGTYHGKETIRLALANSHNIPAVKTEADIGLSTFIDRARNMGISTWNDSSRFGLSLTLGSGEVLMTDLATAYGVFANGGTRVDLNPLLEVKTAAGDVLYRNPCAAQTTPCAGVQVMDPTTAYQITNILSDNVARSRAFGMNSVLAIRGQEVAVKTGTTNGLRDNWTFGYTTNRLVATWVGNNDNKQMSRIASGITGASPIWNQLMKLQLDEKHPHTFAVPPTLLAIPLCRDTGRIACGADTCASKYTEYFVPGSTLPGGCTDQTAESTPSPVKRTTLTRDQVLDGAMTP